ncbi:MAG: serine hydrolase [Marivita sp.]|uniref:serine hydrolase n=1 Tax=Marivita sp. TaxID=2003365 RepID=UPI003EF67E20
MIWRGVATLLLLAGSAAAQTADDITASVQAWMTDQNAKGVLVVQAPDDSVSVTEMGLSADTPVEFASLAKAITATCALELVTQGRLTWTDAVSGYVPGFDGITVGDLVTHQSGVVQDATQGLMRGWLDDACGRPHAVPQPVV